MYAYIAVLLAAPRLDITLLILLKVQHMLCKCPSTPHSLCMLFFLIFKLTAKIIKVYNNTFNFYLLPYTFCSSLTLSCYSCDSVVSILRKNELIRAQKSLKVFLKGWKSSPNITITSKNSSSFLSVGDNNVVISNENLLNLANNKKPTDFSLVGLKNLGNTCYFNSLLQVKVVIFIQTIIYSFLYRILRT
jgi:hypothetical protein